MAEHNILIQTQTQKLGRPYAVPLVLLLVKVPKVDTPKEWERDAARHVSLTESSKEVCNLLVCWRKMELSYWLATLDSAEIQIGNRCMTLWFHLYDLFLRPGSYREQQQQQQMNAKRKQPSKNNNDNADVGDDNGDVQQLEIDRLDALIELFEKGPIGEFISRWRLVASIYSALNIWPGLSDKERSSSKRIVGNAVWFYAQFLPYISEELKNLRKPIEKEMKVSSVIIRSTFYFFTVQYTTNLILIILNGTIIRV
ncbi:unnamed protein product [Trichobilharzia regenti]|nr:unnamed protein product [Trichobilharzia regenti]